MSCRSAPSVSPCPANRPATQRCSSPPRQGAQRPHGIAGSTRDALARARAVLDHGHRLVAEHERALEDRVADRALGEPVQVGAAEPDRRDAQHHLVGPRLAHRLVVHADVADVVEAERDHRGWP